VESRNAEAIREVFESAYFAQYGVNPSHVPIEVVSWRLTAQGPEDRVDSERPLADVVALPEREKAVPLWPAAGPARVYARASLGRGQRLAGPALIEERETTIVLPPGWDAVVDDSGCITAKRGT
jgi:N-methylhydantoinase A